MSTSINVEKKHGVMKLECMNPSKGNPFKIKIDQKTGIMQFTQNNEGIFDEVHMSVTQFAAIVKALELDNFIEGNFDLVGRKTV